VVLSQLFLGIGWLRAAVAHGLSPSWWDGEELLTFIAERSGHTLPGYQLFLGSVVEQFPTGVAAIVLLAEIAVGLALLLDVKPLEALAVGCFLNLHFIAAGQVNPSIFYLIVSLGVIGWRLESRLSTEQIRQLARRSTIGGLLVALLLLPAVGTVEPANVIEDPASVLILLMLLVVIALWTAYLRRSGPALGDEISHRRWLTTEEVVAAVEDQTDFQFSAELHATVARKVGVRPTAGEAERTMRRGFAVYVVEADRYLYSRTWVRALVMGLSTAEGFEKLADEAPRPRHVPSQVGIGPGDDTVPLTLNLSTERGETRAAAAPDGPVEEFELVPIEYHAGSAAPEQPGFEIVVKT
jgi:hypothetical protein